MGATKAATGGQTIMAKTATAAKDHQKVAAAKVATAGMGLTGAIPLLEVITVVSVTTGTLGVELSLIQSANDAESPIVQRCTLVRNSDLVQPCCPWKENGESGLETVEK